MIRRLPLPLALCLVALPVLAEDIDFNLTNSSNFAIDEFYASPSTENDWGDDILGTDVLLGGESGVVTIADGSDQCLYDLKAVDEAGEEHLLPGLDICADPDIDFNK